MRRIFFFFILTCSISINAQISKSNWLVGGDASYSSVKYESNSLENSSTTSSVRLNPNLGYFFADKFAGGLQLNFAFLEPGSNINSNRFAFGPFVRYYFLEEENLINLFTQINYNFGFGKNASDIKTDSYGYGIKGGTVLFFNSSVGMELTFNYLKSTSKSDISGGRKDISKTFLIGLGFQIHLDK